ncbi:lipopolysaccharide biosynthesis protein [Shewanella sp. MEBiC00475]|uniref:lipopolysaccharide biosynthesis protein n=1 Tax=Shewanella sp. MEBiC00475 TaxID=2575361 RepID=UPI0010C024B9|nr:lipopolysaccharide biosynthesis protein [Shewanella sp. MEBiC00475]
MSDLTIDKKLIKSILHSMTGRYLVYAIQLISMIVLARVFTPEIFGIFAIIQVFAVFFALVSEMGFGPALVNETNISKNMRNGIYSFTWILGVVVAILFFALSPLISWFYNNEIYQLLVIPVAIGIIFNTAAIVPLSAFNRDKKFITIARCEGVAEITSIIVILISTKFMDPIWALSLKPLTVAFIRFILVLVSSSKTEIGMPSFGKELSSIKKILAFSKHQAGFNFLNYFSRNLDNILVGKYLGTASLGIYDKAYQLMRYPLLLLTFAMSPAIQPVMKELKNDLHEFEKLHNKFIRYVSILGLIVGFSIFYLSDYIVLFLLGEQWGEVSPLLKILAVSIPIQIVMSTSGGFYQAAGRADLMLKCGMFSFFTNVTGIIIGVWTNDLQLLCWAIVACSFINYIQCYYIMGRSLLPSGVFNTLKNILLTLVGVIILFIIVIN